MKSVQEKAPLDELLALRARYDERFHRCRRRAQKLSGAQGAQPVLAPTREALSSMEQASRRLAEQERATLPRNA